MRSKPEEAIILFQSGKLKEAKDLCLEILKNEPNNYEILHLLGLIAFQTQHYSKSLEIIDKAIAIKPDKVEFYNSRAIVSVHLKKLQQAIDSWTKVIEIKPDYVEAYYNKGNALLELKKTKEAIKSWVKAIELKPDYAQAHNNLGNAYIDLNKLEDAVKCFEKAIELKPDYSEAHYNKGNALKNSGKLNEAIESYDKAIEENFNTLQVHINRGNTLLQLNKPENAIDNYNKALEIKPDSFEAYYNRGNAFAELKKVNKALENYDKAIKIDSNNAEAYKARGNALLEIYKTEAALENYEKAVKIKPDLDYVLGQKFFLKNSILDWNFFDEDLKKIEEKILKNQKCLLPFPALSIFDSLKIQKLSAEIFLKGKFYDKRNFKKIAPYKKNQKIKIGYYSADFRNHAVSYLIKHLFQLHDRSKFEIIGFYFGPDKVDEMNQKISSSLDKFINVNLKNDKEVVQLSRSLKIDIAVDLMGYTKGNRFGIFIERCAPIQVSYLGYSSTTGSECIDYVIGDKTVIPKESQKYYSEKIIYLPNSFMVNDSTKQISDKIFSKKELGLPEDTFVFCSFNKFYKILPKTFDIWMRLLKKVEGSVFWLFEDNFVGVKNIQREANKRGIDSKRIIFAKYTKLLSDHLARHKVADLFMDTAPYNGHTRVSDALWSSLPVITQIGKSFPSRVSASLLNALDLPELITNNAKEYENLAFEFATNKNKLNEVKEKLKQNIKTKSLFNTKIFCNNIETAYTEIYNKNVNNLSIENIEVN